MFVTTSVVCTPMGSWITSCVRVRAGLDEEEKGDMRKGMTQRKKGERTLISIWDAGGRP